MTSRKPILKFGCPNIVWSPLSKLVCAWFTASSKILLGKLNTTKVHNREQFLELLERRNNKGLLTVSNHNSCLDDPFLWNILSWKHVFNSQILRWSTGAEDVCFKAKWLSFGMGLGKVLPLVRGDGVYQKTMDVCVNELDRGKWVHIFPEGKVNVEKEPMRLKWGVGRLIADCNIPPVVLLIYHVGFDNVLPNKRPYRLKIGEKASVYVASPMDFSQDVEILKNLNKTPLEIRKCLTDKIQEQMAKLKVKAEQFHKSQHS